MSKELTEEQKKMLKNMGALGYDSKKIISIMGFDKKEFEKEFNNEDSEIKELYNNGAFYAEYLIDLKLFEMAQAGDIKAINKLEVKKLTRKK